MPCAVYTVYTSAGFVIIIDFTACVCVCVCVCVCLVEADIEYIIIILGYTRVNRVYILLYKIYNNILF